MKKERRNNKGFSLIELIIVIGIIVVLAGFLAPKLIKYLEKTKVQNDQEMISAVYAAVVYAVVDKDVLSDPDAKALVDKMSTQPIRLEDLNVPEGNKLAVEVMDTLGWTTLDSEYYETLLESHHSDNSEIWFMNKGSAINPLAMWITYTDSSGEKNIDGAQPVSYTDLDNGCVNICIK